MPFNQPLAEAIAKAYRRQEQLESGEYVQIADLAKALGVAPDLCRPGAPAHVACT